MNNQTQVNFRHQIDTRQPSANLHQTMSRQSQPTSIDTFISREDSFPLSPTGTASPITLSPSSPTSNPHISKGRSDTHSSKRSNNEHRRYNNTVQYYGRHSNYWLFGGFSVRDTVRDGVDWVRHHGKNS